MRSVTNIAQKLTLKEARENSGFSIEEVAPLFGLSVNKLEEYEVDASKAPADIVVGLCVKYNIGVDHIYTGEAEDVYAARKPPRVTNLNDAATISEIKTKVIILSHYVEQDNMFTRNHILRSLKEIIFDIYGYEEVLIRPLLDEMEELRE